MADESIISTAEDLAKQFTLTAELMQQVSKTWKANRLVMTEISAKDAREVVYQRLLRELDVAGAEDFFSLPLTGGGDSPRDRLDAAVRKMAETIVLALPKEAMSESLVTRMDLRPYLQLAAEQAEKAPDNRNPLTSPIIANRWNEIQTTNLELGVTPFRGSRQVGLAPSAAATSSTTDENGNPVAVDASGNPVDQRYATTGAGQVDFGDLNYLLGTGQAAVGQLTPEQMATPIDVGNIPGMERPTRTSDPRVNSRDLPSGRTMNRTTIGGAMDWMYGLSNQEVLQLQQQLENAGYYTLVQYDAESDQMTWTDVKYEQGYAGDQATRAAWYRAISDAKAEGKSISDTLVAKRGEFASREQTVRQQMVQARQSEFDKQLGSSRVAADKMAIDTLGRRLTSEEYVRVRQYLRELQTSRVDDLAGSETGDWMSSAPMTGYTQDEFSQGVTDVLMPEVEGRMGMSTNRQMKKWLGMD
jgi:hypothetical protein